MGAWTRTTLPPVGDYYNLANNVITEDLCTDNRTNLWVDWDPVVFSLVPRLDDRLLTPPVFVNRSSEVLVAFDVYRNLPLEDCFYYSVNYRYKNAGAVWVVDLWHNRSRHDDRSKDSRDFSFRPEVVRFGSGPGKKGEAK